MEKCWDEYLIFIMNDHLSLTRNEEAALISSISISVPLDLALSLSLMTGQCTSSPLAVTPRGRGRSVTPPWVRQERERKAAATRREAVPPPPRHLWNQSDVTMSP